MDVKIIETELKTLINNSLDRLYKEDAYLIDNRPYRSETNGNHHVGERSIVFRLAHYMQNMMDANPAFANYILDCEYNRNGIHAKALPSFPNGVYPDIIIHNRGNNDSNLLIMEVKTYWNSNTSIDIEKISEFVDSSGEYHFALGASLTINKHRKDIKINWYSSDNNND